MSDQAKISSDVHDVLHLLLADDLLNEFQPTEWTPWISPDDKHTVKFVERAFPLLAKYHLGKECDELVKAHPWMDNLAMPSKRHEIARTFHQDPTHNLSILEVFIKLRFLRLWGFPMMRRSPLCYIIYEMFKICNDMEQPSADSSFENWIVQVPESSLRQMPKMFEIGYAKFYDSDLSDIVVDRWKEFEKE
jgi:hypothetical protein